jgi:tripartite-type tricarboxylate transporter receptor subunit TctC
LLAFGQSALAARPRNGSDVPTVTGAEFRAFVAAEVARWAKVAQEVGFKME